MLREYRSIISRCGMVSPQSKVVSSLFMRILTSPALRAKLSGTLEVETQGWTLKEITLDDTYATMAFDGVNVRCLSIKIGREKPVSVLNNDFATVERIFCSWAQQLLRTESGPSDLPSIEINVHPTLSPLNDSMAMRA